MAMVREDGGRREGETRRDEALARLAAWRPVLIRRLQRAMLAHLIDHGPATSDVVRAAVPIPDHVDPRVVGAAVRGLAAGAGLIVAVGLANSVRPLAHARHLVVWGLSDTAAAELWLAANPELSDPDEPAADPSPAAPPTPAAVDLFTAIDAGGV